MIGDDSPALTLLAAGAGRANAAAGPDPVRAPDRAGPGRPTLRPAANSLGGQYLFTHADGEKYRGAGLLAADAGRTSPHVVTIRTGFPYQTLQLAAEGTGPRAFSLWAAYVPEDAGQRTSQWIWPHRPLRLAAIAVNIADNVLQAVALHVGQLALVQPLIVCNLLSAVLIAVLARHRRAGRFPVQPECLPARHPHLTGAGDHNGRPAGLCWHSPLLAEGEDSQRAY